jgi:hypothetical protein
MILSIFDERNKLLSWPLRFFAPYGKDLLEEYEDSVPGTIGTALLFAYASTPTFVGNILLPGKLVTMGIRPQPIVESMHFVKGLPYIKPMWTVFHGATPAYNVGKNIGAKVGGKTGLRAGVRVGGKIGGRVAARLIPGVGWAMLAYDVYDIAYNRSLWGFDFGGA